MRLGELASKIGGELIGAPDLEIRGVAGLDSAGEGDLTFIKDARMSQRVVDSGAAAVIVPEYMEGLGVAQIVSKNPLLAFSRALELFYVARHEPLGVMNGAYISEKARIGRGVTVYPLSYICGGAEIGANSVIFPGVYIGKGSRVGDDCLVYPGVTVMDGVEIGSRVVIHPNSVIGSDGFGYVRDGDRHHKIPQVGGVIIGDDVEIGACVTIDRATTGNTVIGEGTKIDNLVQIAHNVTIGRHSIIVSQVGIAGSTKIGDYVTLAGQVGVSDHSEIESHTVVGAMSGVLGKLKRGVYLGVPVRPHREFLKLQGLINRLPDIVKEVKKLRQEIEVLKGEASGSEK